MKNRNFKVIVFVGGWYLYLVLCEHSTLLSVISLAVFTVGLVAGVGYLLNNIDRLEKIKGWFEK